MLTRLFFIITLLSFCCFLYGVYFAILDSTGENECRMTYMFEYPQFVRIHFKGNQRFSKYGLYAYSEGHLTERTRSMQFNGAPVIFVPGNSGSFKQARSLASVALQKSLENKRVNYVDFFTINFNEEYSALFGGYLEDEKEFLKMSIKTVLNLYKKLENPSRQVVLIGHSMGGKIAQSMLSDSEISPLINTIIAMAAPLDKPVLNLDFYFEAFYRKVNTYLEQYMTEFIVTNETNFCGTSYPGKTVFDDERNSSISQNVLFISLGGEKKDVQVNSGLTYSKYSDIHALTTFIPNVWVSIDHLCTVWCLQLVLVINRFLYSILDIPKGKVTYSTGQRFIEDKNVRLSKAHHFFVKSYRSIRGREMNLVARQTDLQNWIEESRRVYTEKFEHGLNETRTQMIRLLDLPQYNTMSVEAINLDTEDWVFGCAANEIYGDMRYCSKGTSLSHLVKNLPSAKHKRQHLLLDLHKLKRSHPSWTHIILRLYPTREKLQINVDVHDPGARQLTAVMPKWFSFSKVDLLPDTISGSSFYRLKISRLEETHQTIEVELVPRSCTSAEHHAVVEICVPWARGSKRYQYITRNNASPLSIYTPLNKPMGYNTTENQVIVNMHLDPSCRYAIGMKNSFAGTLSRIAQQYFHWLPSHLVAVLLLSLRHQISITPKNYKFKCGKLHSALLHSSSFFLITAARVFAKILSSFEMLPQPDNFNQSMLISVIIHGTSVTVLFLIVGLVWLLVSLCGKIAHMMLLKLLKLPMPTISSIVVPVVQKFPICAGVLLISIANASCGGVCLICGCVIYFILMTKQYEDYLEDYVYNTIKRIAENIFGSNRTKRNEQTDKTDNNDAKDNDASTEEIEGDASTLLITKPDGKEDEEKDSQEKLVKSLTQQEKNEEATLDALIKEAFERQRKIFEKENPSKKEYDAVHEGLQTLNFHMTLFLMLVILTLLNVPSTLSWAKNFRNSPVLSSDPSFFPTLVTLVSLCYIWQFSTPKNLYGYSVIAAILYVCAAICLVYCQDSIYRLNAVIGTVFAFIAIHQICAPVKTMEENHTSLNEEWKYKVEKFKELLNKDTAQSPEGEVS